MADSVFANGAEYRRFDEVYCCRCKRYVPWEEATTEKPVCSIEELIAAAEYDESKFPRQFIKRDSVNEHSYCIKFEAAG